MYMNILYNTGSKDAFSNQTIFLQENVVTLSGIDNGYKSLMSIGHVLLTEEV